MSESMQHIALVAAARKWAADTYFGGDLPAVLVHSAADSASPRPPMINGFIPDLYGRLPDRSGEIIGEAKTAGDLDNIHTLSQLTAFLKACGCSDQSVFVFAVPWHCEMTAKNLVRLIMRSDGSLAVKSVVLQGLPG